MKKDFWEALSFKLWKNGFEKWVVRKISEWEYLFWVFYWLRSKIWFDERLSEDDIRVDFLLKDLNWVMNTRFPKNVENKVKRDSFLSFWRTLRRLWCDDLISDECKKLYGKEMIKFDKDMEKLQEELNELVWIK